jgi:hypothetical protein
MIKRLGRRKLSRSGESESESKVRRERQGIIFGDVTSR